jgi:hypothetical protein
MFQTEFVEKIKTGNSLLRLPPPPHPALVPGGPQTTIRRKRMGCCVPKASNTHTEYVILIVFPCSHGCTNAPQWYVWHTLCVLLVSFVLYLGHVVVYVTKSGVNLKVGIVHFFQVFSFFFLPCLLRESCHCARHKWVWDSVGTVLPILHVGSI